MLYSHDLLSRFSPPPPSRHHPQRPHFRPPFRLIPAPAGRTAVRASGPRRWLAELPEATAPQTQGTDDSSGPIEIPPSSRSTLFAEDENPSPLQTSTSVLLTGAITVFLYRSLRRRAKRAKELRVRSTGMKKAKDLKEEALDSLKAMGAAPVEAGAPPSPVQALLGSIAAGVIAVILYKFTTTIEAALNRQAVSDNFSVRQITITISLPSVLSWKLFLVTHHLLRKMMDSQIQSNLQRAPPLMWILEAMTYSKMLMKIKINTATEYGGRRWGMRCIEAEDHIYSAIRL